MELEKIQLKKIKPYANNAKLHPAEQVEQIKKSIEDFGYNDPIAIDENNEIIEGHGRYLALMEMKDGDDEIEVLILRGLTEKQKIAYRNVHNQLTMNTGIDLDLLQEELDKIENEYDMAFYGLETDYEEDIEEVLENPYSQKVKIPQYEPTGENPDINDLVDDFKTNELIKEIETADITEEQKEFLKKSAQRHLTFNYKNIAEYYAHQDKTMQDLMEKSALVIIDLDDAIANGYVEVMQKFQEMIDEDE